MSQPYVYALLPDKKTLFLHGQERVIGRIRDRFLAAAGDPDIRAAVRAGFLRLFDEVVRVSGLPAARVADFIAGGMYLNIAAALELPEGVLPPPPV